MDRPAAAHGFHVDLVEARDQVRVLVTGELDLVTAPVLDRHLEGAVGRGRPEIVVDLGGVTFLDVRGVNSLLGASQAAEAAGIGFALRGAGDHVLRVLSVCGLEGAFRLD